MAETETIWTIRRGDKIVGTAHLTWHDEGMNIRGGAFVEGPGYGEVQPVFRLFERACDRDDAVARERYYRERDALALTIWTARGDEVPGTVHIVDFRGTIPGAALEIEIFP